MVSFLSVVGFEALFKRCKKKPKYNIRTEQVVSASKFYDFSPCKPRAKEIVFAERNLFRFRFNSSNKKTNQTNKHEKQFRKHEFSDEWQTLHGIMMAQAKKLYRICRHCIYYYCAVCYLCYFLPFLHFKNKSRVECCISNENFGCRNNFTTIQEKFEHANHLLHTNAIAAAYSIASHRICCCCCIIIYGAIFNS